MRRLLRLIVAVVGLLLTSTLAATAHDVGSRIPGDANGDRMVDEADAEIMARHWLQNGASWKDGDFNGDGLVNDDDASALAANWTKRAATESVRHYPVKSRPFARCSHHRLLRHGKHRRPGRP